MAEYVNREDVLEKLTNVFMLQASTAKAIVDSIPSADAVSRAEYEQTRWERDVALFQLSYIGKGFGEKMDSIGCRLEPPDHIGEATEMVEKESE